MILQWKRLEHRAYKPLGFDKAFGAHGRLGTFSVIRDIDRMNPRRWSASFKGYEDPLTGKRPTTVWLGTFQFRYQASLACEQHNNGEVLQ